MKTLSFDQIAADVARFHAEHNAPIAVACRAVDTLGAALADLDTADRDVVRELLAELVADLDAASWDGFAAALAVREG